MKNVNEMSVEELRARVAELESGKATPLKVGPGKYAGTISISGGDVGRPVTHTPAKWAVLFSHKADIEAAFPAK